MINFTLKITKFQELPGVSPPGPPPGRCPGPTGGLKAPRPHDYEKKITPLNQNPGSAPAFLEKLDFRLDFISIHFSLDCPLKKGIQNYLN